MRCLNCSGEIPEGARFCPHCGKELREAAPQPVPRMSLLATISLILGLLSLLPLIGLFSGIIKIGWRGSDVLFISCVALLIEIAAVVLGIIAIRDIVQSRGRLRGRGVALAGIIIGAIPMFQTFIMFYFSLPGHQQGSIRAKVSRVKADMRTLGIALEAYYVDNNSYPPWAIGEGGANSFAGSGAWVYKIPTFRIWKNNAERGTFHTLTTPISYVGSYLPDPFAKGFKDATFGYYSDGNGWILWSPGPDVQCDLYPDIVEVVYRSDIAQPSLTLLCGSSSVAPHHAYTWDPTNGTISPGDVYRVKQ